MTSTASPVGALGALGALGTSARETLCARDKRRIQEALAAPSLRRSLAAMVRRRVPANDVEDVAQTILCDALAAPGIPSDPEELRRFVTGIARHKVADFHRHARRTATRTADLSAADAADAAPPPALTVDPAPIEARALLARIASSVAESASRREQETLEWLVREHAGEQLQTIAEESGVPAPAVRQRVSRLRRVLRAQWAHALVLLAVGGSCAVLTERAHRDHASAIVADPTGDPIARAATLMQGRWRIESIVARDAGDTAAAALEAKVVDIRISGRRVELVGPVHTTSRAIGAATRRPDGSLSIELLDDGGNVQHLTARVDGERMLLTVHDGRLRGTARLVRR